MECAIGLTVGGALGMQLLLLHTGDADGNIFELGGRRGDVERCRLSDLYYSQTVTTSCGFVQISDQELERRPYRQNRT